MQPEIKQNETIGFLLPLKYKKQKWTKTNISKIIREAPIKKNKLLIKTLYSFQILAKKYNSKNIIKNQ